MTKRTFEIPVEQLEVELRVEYRACVEAEALLLCLLHDAGTVAAAREAIHPLPLPNLLIAGLVEIGALGEILLHLIRQRHTRGKIRGRGRRSSTMGCDRVFVGQK